MTPFLGFRSWLAAGPRNERVLAGVAASLVLALLAWASVPGSPGGSRSSEALTSAAAAPAPTKAAAGQAVRPVTPGPVAGTLVRDPALTGGVPGAPGTPARTGPQTGPAASGCAAGATDQGVTATTVLVGVSLPDLGSLGAAFNVPTVAQQQKAWDAVFAVYNKAGGVQCRRIVAKYYSDDVTSSTAEHATCLQMVQDKLFAVLQNFYFPEQSTCPAQNKLPNIWYIPPHTDQVNKYYPYILSYQPDYDRLVRDYIRGAKQLGWFEGHGKVGVLEGTCFPDLNHAIERELTAVGISSSQWELFNYGCDPSAPSQPDKDTQAVLQFKRAGVTHVVSVAYGRSFSFSSVADGQDYKAKYAVMDDGQVAGSNHSSANPTGAGFDGALAIAVSQLGEADSPGVRPSPATADCVRVMAAAGLPSPLSAGGAAYGSPCAGIKVFVAAASHAAMLTRTSLAPGLAQVGRLDLSFPAGPGDFHDAGNPTGGGYWRPLRFDRSATCWRVASATFQKGFA